MATEDELATELEERERDAAIAAVRRLVAQPALKPCGACHYCGERIRSGLFCQAIDAHDEGCARDYALEQDAKKRNGTA